MGRDLFYFANVPLDYCFSIHQSPFYLGARPEVAKINGVRIAVNGTEIRGAVPPFILGGRTLCQLRPLGEAMGAQVDWHNDSQTVTLTLGNRVAKCQVGSEVGVINNQGHRLDEPPIFVGQHVVVPVRFLAEGLGYQVEWEPATQFVNLVR